MKKKLVFLLLACLMLASSMVETASADECQHEFSHGECTKERYCFVCEQYMTTNTEHSWGEWQFGDGPHHARYCTNYDCTVVDFGNHIGGAATCTDNAVCTVCGGSYGEINPDAHDWDAWKSHEGSDMLEGHSRVCKWNRYHHEEEAHTGGNPTCSDSATCDVCKANYINFNNHAGYGTTDWGTYDNTKHVKLCEGCKYVVDRAEHDFDSDADPACDTCGYTREVAHEHYGGTATCTEMAVCDDCKTAYGNIDADNHNEVVLSAVPPTYTETGLTEGVKCDDCGEILVPQEVVPMLAQLPQTGDDSNVILWFALACISLFGMTMLVRKKKEA